MPLDARQQDAEIRRSFVGCLGGKPAWGGLGTRTTRRKETPAYIAEWTTLACEPGEEATGLLVLPNRRGGPWPVVVAHHGFWGNKDLMLLGTDDFGPGDGDIPLYSLVERGIAVFALDGRCHGGRASLNFRLPYKHSQPTEKPRPNRIADPKGYRESIWEDFEWAHREAIVDGTSIGALETWDAVRAIDYLATREEVDIMRVGTFGHSRGGDIAWYLALADERVKAVCTSGCMQTFEACLAYRRDKGAHAWIPGLRKLASRETLLSAVAPRPLLALEGELDHARDGEQPIWDVLTRAYAALGVPDQFAFKHFPGGHGDFLKTDKGYAAIADWFTRWL